jgi:hypothetical protein
MVAPKQEESLMDQTPKPTAAKKTETKKGINWLNVIGLLLIIVIVGGIVSMFLLGPMLKDMRENKIVQDVSGMQPWLTAMSGMTKSQIAEEAAHVESTKLTEDPTGYEGRWVVTWGAVQAEESNAVAGNIARNIFSEKNYPAFILADGVVFVDISGEGETQNLPDGTIITGYGKVFNLALKDVWALPIVGPNLKQEFGNVKDMEEHVVFFLSKGYDIGEPGATGALVTPPAPGADGAVPADGTVPADGAAPAGGGEAAPPAEGGEAAPPAGGGEQAPPAGGGEQTPPPAQQPPAGGK